MKRPAATRSEYQPVAFVPVLEKRVLVGDAAGQLLTIP